MFTALLPIVYSLVQYVKKWLRTTVAGSNVNCPALTPTPNLPNFPTPIFLKFPAATL